MLLVGCGDAYMQDNKLRKLQQVPRKIQSVHVQNIHMLHRKFMNAGLGAIQGLFFAKDISMEDKIMLEDNVQAALDSGENREWAGNSAQYAVEIGKKFEMNGFVCHEFSENFIFADNAYLVSNKACKIYLNKNGSGYWVLEDSVEDYLANEVE